MFERNVSCYSLTDMVKLQRSYVAICGLGGGGGYIAEILARTGVGHFLLIDGDKVEDSNKNRQICALDSTIGSYKVDVIAKRLKDINRNLYVEVIRDFIRDGAYLKGKNITIVVDCVDTSKEKRNLCSICESLSLPYSTGGLSGMFLRAAVIHGKGYAEKLYKDGPSNSLSANPSSLLIQAGFQAQETMNYILGRNTHTLNKVINVSHTNYALIVEDI